MAGIRSATLTTTTASSVAEIVAPTMDVARDAMTATSTANTPHLYVMETLTSVDVGTTMIVMLETSVIQTQMFARPNALKIRNVRDSIRSAMLTTVTASSVAETVGQMTGAAKDVTTVI